jgi:hypothetical protein
VVSALVGIGKVSHFMPQSMCTLVKTLVVELGEGLQPYASSAEGCLVNGGLLMTQPLHSLSSAMNICTNHQLAVYTNPTFLVEPAAESISGARGLISFQGN